MSPRQSGQLLPKAASPMLVIEEGRTMSPGFAKYFSPLLAGHPVLQGGGTTLVILPQYSNVEPDTVISPAATSCSQLYIKLVVPVSYKPGARSGSLEPNMPPLPS